MRLRQVAAVGRDLEKIDAQLSAVLGVANPFSDPAVHPYGLRNGVWAVGNDFLEVVSPTTPDASGQRYIDRMGGDAGYMILLQVDDVEPYRARAQAAGVRIVDEMATDHHRCLHFHPRDLGGVLMSVDAAPVDDHLEPGGDWEPGGADWRIRRAGSITGIDYAEVRSADPDAIARIWSELLDIPCTAAPDAIELRFDKGKVRFVAGAEPTRFTALGLMAEDARSILEKAEEMGLAGGRGLQIAGLDIAIADRKDEE